VLERYELKVDPDLGAFVGVPNRHQLHSRGAYHALTGSPRSYERLPESAPAQAGTAPRLWLACARTSQAGQGRVRRFIRGPRECRSAHRSGAARRRWMRR
jgi:hypothetical protein